ncbi:PREDICTED: uncharacterized protein LOC104586392 [Nelumbo nucifera]|uniref:Uncharacterized protein LOC104586392 n=2 Tax=Nelumbo nucifera TaxID=4432 RepID=A0A1U7Z564_NELNU|nr:PREDICTED: uncharacterized protein LOC104586392 [Nelumbo nucifera]XP_010241932.1 PREDICTED: uncharacterized protein LOC104586392 [Nelumbo nucifera]XP_010241933.1 PREDICTED: uncharacterized protein LOC104586392 [Nelumbo nucifera]DAD47377.1 TPA_asm: hypothetical protein HUJ06_017314 [Nelumbo nucifera]
MSRNYPVGSLYQDSWSMSHKTMPSGPGKCGSSGELKRGSIYKNSRTVGKMKKMGEFEGRREIGLSCSSDTSLSFRIFDSLSQSHESNPSLQQKRSTPFMPLMTDQEASIRKTYKQPDPQDSLELSFRFPSPQGNVACKDVFEDRFFEICLDPEDGKQCPAETIERGSMKELSFRCNQTIGPPSNGNGHLERDTVGTFQKSSSAKVGMPHLLCRSESSPSKSRPRGSMEELSFRCNPTIGSPSNGNGPLERDTISTFQKSSSAKVGMPHLPCRLESSPSKARPRGSTEELSFRCNPTIGPPSINSLLERDRASTFKKSSSAKVGMAHLSCRLESSHSKASPRGSVEELSFRFNPTSGPPSNGNDLMEGDTVCTFQKSSSEKVGMPHLPCRLESSHSGASPRGSMKELSFRCNPTIGPPSIGNSLLERDRDSTFQKSSSAKVGMAHLPCRLESSPSKASPRGSVEELSFRFNPTSGPPSNGNDLMEGDTVCTFQKSSSTKVGMPHLPCRLENGPSKATPKGRFSPIRRMLDPIMKSKSHPSPSVSMAELGNLTTVEFPNMGRNQTLCKSLLNDLTKTVVKEESSAQFVNKYLRSSVVSSSPAHLHGLLKLEYKHGAPFFEFSLRNFEDVLMAKTWKANNAFNWVYTFHTMNGRKKKNSSGWGSRERHKEASMVGQMRVSCYLCSEIRNAGAFDNSMVTEFVLYDIGHATKSLAPEESSTCSLDSIKPPKSTGSGNLVKGLSVDPNVVFDPAKHKLEKQPASGSDGSNDSTPYPWAPADLHPNSEIAAIVIQVPFKKKDSFKDKQGVSGKVHSNLFEFSMVEQRNDGKQNSMKPANVKVVTATGIHGLPSTDNCGGPSPLLDRLRSGGHCDCGGWDMACPLLVFGNPPAQNVQDHQFMGSQQHLELFVQGAKDKMPALTIIAINEGQYSVDFHARLSTLQAFSICVAILHNAEVSTAVGQERNRQRLHSNSLKVLLEEEVRFLIEAVTGEEKRKFTKRKEEILPSSILNPPFSPIAQV